MKYVACLCLNVYVIFGSHSAEETTQQPLIFHERCKFVYSARAYPVSGVKSVKNAL